jgi:hypothetical protein
MDPSKDESNRLKLGPAFLYSAAIHMHYRQIGCAKSVVNYRMSKLLKASFCCTNSLQCAHRYLIYIHVIRVFHAMGLAAHTKGLVAHTMGLAALLGDGLLLEILVMKSGIPIDQHTDNFTVTTVLMILSSNLITVSSNVSSKINEYFLN